MDKHSLIDLLTYDAWAMNKILDLAQPSADELPEKFHRVISHLFNAQAIWLSRMKGEHPESGVWENHESKDWTLIHQNNTKSLQEFLRSLGDEDLAKHFHYLNSRGQEFSNSYSDTLTHLCLHGQYHRGQLVQLMKGTVEPLPATDYIFYKR